MTEAEALATQGLADLGTYRHLLAADRDSVAESQVLHALQMAGEKIAKALLYALDPAYRVRDDGERKQSHASLSRLAGTLSAKKKLAAALQMPEAKYEGCLSRFGRWYLQIELLQPQLAGNGRNVEYPWQDGNTWVAPCDYRFGLLAQFQKGEALDSVRFLGRLARAVPALLVSR